MSLEWRYTYHSGGSDNGNPNESLGGNMSSYQLSSTPLNNLFDNVSYDEASAGDDEYRCLVLFANGNNYSDVSVYMSTETSSPDTQIDMWMEGKTTTPIEVADESTAPSGSSFQHYTSSNKLSVGSMANGDKVYIWFKRHVNAGAASTSSDSGVISVEYIQTS